MGRSADRAVDTELVRESIELLSVAIGPRRPTSAAERAAAELLVGRLADAGVSARSEAFGAYPTFALPQAVGPLVALTGAAVGRRWRRGGGSIAALAVALAVAEDDYRLRPLSRLLARWPSRNVVGTVEPSSEAARTLCLVGHLDSSRSGLIFAPPVARQLRRLLAATAASLGVEALSPWLRERSAGRAILSAARAWLLTVLGLLAERELRGADVPGANDNASGAALVATLAAEVAARPLDSTRLVVLITGAEEAGTLGIEAFLRRHEAAGWIFLNFDGVAAPATLRYLPREGLLRVFDADVVLLSLADRLATRRPDLGLARARRLVGLSYDSTAVLARGGRALTVSAQDEAIPRYHQAGDDLTNVDEDVLTRALSAARELIAAVDRGEADRTSGS